MQIGTETLPSANTKIEDTAGAYHTLDELCQLELDRGNRMFANLQYYPDLLKAISEKLDSLGFHRVAYFDMGCHALLFETTDNQLVRIVMDNSKHPRPPHPAILQPIQSYAISVPDGTSERRALIEVLPRITRFHESDYKRSKTNEYHAAEHALTLALRNSGFKCDDIKSANVGVLPDGTLIVIDREAVKPLDDHPIITEGEFLKPWLMEDGTWKQHAFLPEIKNHEITGVITPENVAHLKESLGEESQIYKLAKSGKLYRDELGAHIMKACELKDSTNVSHAESYTRARETIDKRHGPSDDWAQGRA